MENITGYTPGPWLVGGKENEWIEDNNYPCRRRIAIIDNGAGINSPEANARLIAAAPEMADRIRELEVQNTRLTEAVQIMIDEMCFSCANHDDVRGCELPECRHMNILKAAIEPGQGVMFPAGPEVKP